MKFGEETGPVVMPNYGAFRFTRVAGATPDAPDVYSPVQAGWVTPGKIQNSALPVWSPLAKKSGAAYAKAAFYGERIRAELAASNPALLMLDREFETQSVDPVFLEPESGLGWYNAGAKNLELVLGVQSPTTPPKRLPICLAMRGRPSSRRTSRPCLPIWAAEFGGRDHTPFPFYVALAALFLPGRPVRLAHDRYQQFQGGIKRHAFKMHTRIGVDRATGVISGFAADHVLDGGGLANFSGTVATVSAIAALGIYEIPKVDITTVALHSARRYRGIDARLRYAANDDGAGTSLVSRRYRNRNRLSSNDCISG